MRQKAAAAAVVLAGALSAVLFLVGQERLAGAVLALLVTGAVLLLLDLRRRLAGVGRALRFSTERERRQLELAESTARSALTSSGASATTRSRMDALQRRVISAVEAERLESADRHVELLETVERLAGRRAD